MDLLLNSFSNQYIEAGCDEVGRGCLCGPVVAASVIVDEDFKQKTIRDSKKLSLKNRLFLDEYIKNNVKSFAISELSSAFIDEYDILSASIYAMHQSLDQLNIRPELILVDGNFFHPYQNIPHECIVKGDDKILSIACASIIAKTYRDQIMIELHDEFPQYGWNKNMGYATKQHRDALNEFGPTIHHRQSFRLDYTGAVVKKVKSKIIKPRLFP